ncbi:MAG: gamma-glutamyltransferase family protein [Stellaceae bacterium]
MPIPPAESWTIAKPAVRSEAGIVVAQNGRAAAAGAEILAAGGNAVDAAVATALALGVREPWMSGIGGVGLLVYGEAATGRVEVVDFTALAPLALDPASYRVSDGVSHELFGWPQVEGDRNLRGYEAICVPGSVAELGLALERFGRMSWREVMAPALALAEEGLPVDWHTALSIALSAADLAAFDASRAVFLPQGLPPVPPPEGAPQRLALAALARSYRRLSEAGPRDFYQGDLAQAILADLRAGGSVIAADDFAQYRARIVAPLAFDYRGVRLHAAPGLTGGPTFARALAALSGRLSGAVRAFPDAPAFIAYAEALREAFAHRLAALGHAAPGHSNTTHLSVVDRAGNMVALTNTLLSRFGSKVVLPRTGIVMNNAMMWFDPLPGRANSMAPGKRPLANMCPVMATEEGAPRLALGACGGRRIIPAVTQLASFLIDFDLSLESAFTTPRLDASTAAILCDARLGRDIIAALADRFPVEVVEESLYPSPFALPSAVMRDRAAGLNTGMTHVHSPAAAAVAEGA